jgi:excisionase family DNA binding protein
MCAVDMTEKKYLTIEDIAEMLNVHRNTVRQWIDAKELPALKLGSQRGYRVAQKDLEAFIRRKRTIQEEGQAKEEG